MPIEAYNSVSKVKRYYALLRHLYKILRDKLLKESKEVILQIVIKAINNIIKLDKLILTLLIFGLYLQLTN